MSEKTAIMLSLSPPFLPWKTHIGIQIVLQHWVLGLYKVVHAEIGRLLMVIVIAKTIQRKKSEVFRENRKGWHHDTESLCVCGEETLCSFGTAHQSGGRSWQLRRDRHLTYQYTSASPPPQSFPQVIANNRLTQKDLIKQIMKSPSGARHCSKAVVVFVHRLRHWPNITTALGQRHVFVEIEEATEIHRVSSGGLNCRWYPPHVGPMLARRRRQVSAKTKRYFFELLKSHS